MSDGEDTGRIYVARAELQLALEDTRPLARLDLNPDPLQLVVSAMADVRQDLGESAEIHLDLLPVTHARLRHRRRRLAAKGGPGEKAAAASAELRQALHGQGAPIGGGGAGSRQPRGGQMTAQRPWSSLAAAETRSSTKATASKLLDGDPLWELQLLIRVRSEIQGRPEAHLRAILGAFEQFAGGGGNYFRVRGWNLGPLHVGADSWLLRRHFDRRCDTGKFKPKRESWVSTGEIAAFFKPPTVRCAANNVARSGGAIPPPPRELPEYHGVADRHLLPMGYVRREAGWQAVGVPLDDTFFQLLLGRSRFGKSERAIVQAVHLAHAGHGLLYLDPHVDALERMKDYLAPVRDRILEINLSGVDHSSRQAGWNLLNMEGRGEVEIEARTSAVVSSFASALSWGSINNRALTLTTFAAQSMCELNLQLPPDLQATLFQMTTILSDEEWRASVLPFLSPQTRAFWSQRFTALSAEAITPVTNLLDRLRSSPAVAALFGSSRSTYDVRAAMDAGQIVLASPAGTGDKDRLIACFFVFDLLRAALSRRDTHPDRRRVFWAFIDEMQELDRAGLLGRVLRESAKFGCRLTGATQSPQSLSEDTRDAWFTNLSHLLVNNSDADVARKLVAQLQGKIDGSAITSLPKYTSIGTVTIGGEISSPFRLRGYEISQVFGQLHDPEAKEKISAAVDVNLARRPIAETLAELSTLDERIQEWALARIPFAERPPEQEPPAGKAAGGGGRGSGRRSTSASTSSPPEPRLPSGGGGGEAAAPAPADEPPAPDNVRQLRPKPPARRPPTHMG